MAENPCPNDPPQPMKRTTSLDTTGGDHISPETLIAVEDILREREETECEETPQKLRVVMWNCGGVGKKEKWIQVKESCRKYPSGGCFPY